MGVQQIRRCICVQSCPTLCDAKDCSPPGSSAHGILQENSGVGIHSFLQGIFPTQGSNPCLLPLLALQTDSLPLSHQGSPLQSSKTGSKSWSHNQHTWLDPALSSSSELSLLFLIQLPAVGKTVIDSSHQILHMPPTTFQTPLESDQGPLTRSGQQTRSGSEMYHFRFGG